MATTETTASATDTLDALLSDLNLLGDDLPDLSAASVEPTEIEIEAAVSSAEAQEVVNAAYATSEVSDATTTTEAVASVEVAPKAETAKKEKKAKAPKEPKVKAEKAPAIPRKHYSSRSEMVEDKMGASLAEYAVLELADAALEGEAMTAHVQGFMDTFKAAGKKVQNRMSFFMFFASGKAADLNGVCKKALNILKKDGQIVTGVEGNFHKCMIAHPYSEGAAKAMGGNTLLAMQKLKMIVAGEKGVWVANPNSLYLAKLNGMLGL